MFLFYVDNINIFVLQYDKVDRQRQSVRPLVKKYMPIIGTEENRRESRRTPPSL